MNGAQLLTITSPQPGQPVSLLTGGWFLVAGRADPSVNSITIDSAVLNPTFHLPPHTPPPACVLLEYRRCTKAKTCYFRWTAKVYATSGMAFRVNVQGYDKSLNNIASTYTDIHLPRILKLASDITWPATNDDLTPYQSDFIPYGDLGMNDSVTAVTLADNATGNSASLINLSNLTSESCWSAEFGTVPRDSNYTLTVTFQLAGTLTVTGLHEDA